MTVEIFPDVQQADLKQLAIAVITQAMRDVKSKRACVEKRLDAILFLTGPDAPWWLEWAGMSDVDPVAFVTSGKLRRARLHTHGRGTDDTEY